MRWLSSSAMAPRAERWALAPGWAPRAAGADPGPGSDQPGLAPRQQAAASVAWPHGEPQCRGRAASSQSAQGPGPPPSPARLTVWLLGPGVALAPTSGRGSLPQSPGGPGTIGVTSGCTVGLEHPGAGVWLGLVGRGPLGGALATCSLAWSWGCPGAGGRHVPGLCSGHSRWHGGPGLSEGARSWPRVGALESPPSSCWSPEPFGAGGQGWRHFTRGHLEGKLGAQHPLVPTPGMALLWLPRQPGPGVPGNSGRTAPRWAGSGARVSLRKLEAVSRPLPSPGRELGPWWRGAGGAWCDRAAPLPPGT